MEVILTIGIPASGKTTWARNYAKDDPNTVIVSRDDIRAAHGFTYDLPKEQIAKNEAFVTKVQHNQIEAALQDGMNVIVADTNINSKFRNKLIKFCHEHGADVVLIPFPIPLDEAIVRDNKRPDRVGADVIVRMYNDLQSSNIDADYEEHPAPVFEPYSHATGDRYKPSAIVVDIDGTVARHVNRSPYDESKVLDDEPIEDVADVVHVLSEYYALAFVSGRKDSCRDDTELWLDRQGFSNYDLFMRKADDNRPDYVVKAEIYDTKVIPKYNIRMAFDDRDQVVRHVRKRGITVAQVAPGRF